MTGVVLVTMLGVFIAGLIEAIESKKKEDLALAALLLAIAYFVSIK